MGDLPDWYITIRAARALGVAPWDLAERPAIWQEWGLAAESAEAKAENELRSHQERRAGNV
jgi:hypothetical protein